MRAGFASGNLVYGLFVAELPENGSDHACSLSNRKV
jgi:hypothetical protein